MQHSLIKHVKGVVACSFEKYFCNSNILKADFYVTKLMKDHLTEHLGFEGHSGEEGALVR